MLGRELCPPLLSEFYKYEAVCSKALRSNIRKKYRGLRRQSTEAHGVVHARVGQIVTFFEAAHLAAPWAP